MTTEYEYSTSGPRLEPDTLNQYLVRDVRVANPATLERAKLVEWSERPVADAAPPQKIDTIEPNSFCPNFVEVGAFACALIAATVVGWTAVRDGDMDKAFLAFVIWLGSLLAVLGAVRQGRKT
jgi:hypothetical protein